MADGNADGNSARNTAPDTSQPLLSILSSIGEHTGASGVSTVASPGNIDLSTIPGNASTATSAPLDTDIDQLMRSLSDSVDTTKMSDEDISKLLGSINADLSSTMTLPSTLTSVPDSDPLAMLSRDLGIDLKASIGPSSTAMAAGSSGSSSNNLTPGGLSGADRSTSSAFSPAQTVGLGNLSLPGNPLSSLQGLSNSTSEPLGAARAQSGAFVPPLPGQPSTPGSMNHSGLSTPFSGNLEHSPNTTASPAQPAKQQMQYRPSNPRPQQFPVAAPLGQRPVSTPQRPQRPQRPMQGNRPPPKVRPPATSSGGQQGSSGAQPRQPQQHPPHRPMHPGQAGAAPRLPARPPIRPSVGEQVDPSRWLTATMSTLPSDQQERLAGLFRGLQAKSVDFPTFMKDAEAIMGPKFQDMLALMRNQGSRSAQASPMQQQQQQRLQKFGRPQGSPGMSAPQQASPSGMFRSSTPLSTPGLRPGMSHAPSPMGGNLPPQGMASGQPADATRNYAFARQLLAQQGQISGGDQLSGLGDLASLLTSGSLQPGGLQSESGASSAGVSGPMSFDMVIARWRRVIQNPMIPNEQLAELSMQLSAFGELLANPTGQMARSTEEERAQQFAQISKLQALIAQRQFGRGSAPQTPQADSRAASPGLDRNGKELKRKGTITMPKPKKRPADPRQQSSPAPQLGAKKQKTGEAGSDPDGDMLPTQLGLAGSLLSLDSISSMGAASSGRHPSGSLALAAGLPASHDAMRGMHRPYADTDDSMDMSVSRNAISRTSTAGTGGHLSDNDDGGRYGERGRAIERMGSRDAQRRPRERRDRDRAGSAMGSGSGGDAFSIDDVIGYTGVDLREESEMIMSGGIRQDMPRRLPSAYSMAYDGPRLSTAIIDGVEFARDRALPANFANAAVLEALVAKVCKGSHMRTVAADFVPYLSHALQERLRSFMELVSAAAYHRTRTQTLPPPPLDPTTRLPLYKITPHLDVKKQLMVIERVDKMREQTRQQRLLEREQHNAMDLTAQQDGEASATNGDEQRVSAAAESGSAEPIRGSDDNRRPADASGVDTGDQAKGAAKRGRKKDDAAESPAYTSKNMPEELQNKISNLTALRAAGGVRKSWMTTSSSDWLGAAGKQSQRAERSPSVAEGSEAGQAPTGMASSKRTASIGSSAGASGTALALDTGSGSGVAPSAHTRNRSSFGAGSDHDGSALATPTPEGMSPTPYGTLRPQQTLAPHRSTALAAPLLVTVRDCLFSLERERLGKVRVGRGGGERVLIQAYAKYGHT